MSMDLSVSEGHLCNMGRMIEEMEGKLRNSLDQVCIYGSCLQPTYCFSFLLVVDFLNLWTKKYFMVTIQFFVLIYLPDLKFFIPEINTKLL